MPCNIVHIQSQIKNQTRYKLFNPYFTDEVDFVKLLCDSGIPMEKRKKKSWFLILGYCFPVGNVLLMAYEKAVF